MTAVRTNGGRPRSALIRAPQLRQLERKLRTQRSALVSAAHDELRRGEEQPFAAIAGEVPDVGDQATAAVLTDFDNEIARRHDETLRDIDAALLRLSSPDYGSCLDCGGEIGFERLMAFPTATRCVACQSQHEKTYATLATPTM